MVDSLNGLRPWWPTWKPAPTKRHILIISHVVREAEKEQGMEPLIARLPIIQVSLRQWVSFHFQKLKGTQPTKTPTVWVAHLEQDSADKEGSAENDDPNGIEGMTEEFLLHLAQAVKETQQDEKCCYHCSSLEHFICECPLVKASRSATHLNQKEGMVPEKGAQTPQIKVTKPKVPLEGMPKHRTLHTDSLLESWSLPLMVWDQKHSQSKDQWRELYGPPW